MALSLGFDLDGVCADFDRHWRDRYAVWFGRQVDKKLNGQWDAFLKGTHFEEEHEFWDWTDAVPNFWADMPPIPGALGGLYTLERLYGHRVRFITSRHEKTRAQTMEWVRRNYPSGATLPPINHVHKSAKGTVDVQVYVDDNPVVLETLKAKPVVVRFVRPWNETCEFGSPVDGWDELVTFVAMLEHPEEGGE